MIHLKREEIAVNHTWCLLTYNAAFILLFTYLYCLPLFDLCTTNTILLLSFPYKCLTCGNVWNTTVKVHSCGIFFILGGKERGKMKDFSCLSDILAYSPNDRFLTDQLYHLLLQLSNISLWNGFILISHLRDLELNPRHPLCV